MIENYKKKVGIPLCVYWGVLVIGNLISQVTGALGCYDLTVSFVFWIIFNIVQCGCMLYLALGKGLIPNVTGKIAAWFLFALHILYAVNNVVILSMEENLFSVLGNGASLLTTLLHAAGIGLLLFSLRTWLAIKIGGLVVFLPDFINGITYLFMDTILDHCYETYDFSLLDTLETVWQICHIATLVFFSAILALSIVWTCVKDKNQQPPAVPSFNNPL